MIWLIIYLAITGLIFGALAALDDGLISFYNPIFVILLLFWPGFIPLFAFAWIAYLITKKFLERKKN